MPSQERFRARPFRGVPRSAVLRLKLPVSMRTAAEATRLSVVGFGYSIISSHWCERGNAPRLSISREVYRVGGGSARGRIEWIWGTYGRTLFSCRTGWPEDARARCPRLQAIGQGAGRKSLGRRRLRALSGCGRNGVAVYMALRRVSVPARPFSGFAMDEMRRRDIGERDEGGRSSYAETGIRRRRRRADGCGFCCYLTKLMEHFARRERL
jgi:hypothetical protein